MTYLWLKAIHIIAVISWMAAMLYLPRLFVYHADAKPGSETSETFKIMERRLLKGIATPAMIATWIFGLAVAYYADAWSQGWLHAKLLFVLLLSGYHGFCAKTVRTFAADQNTRSSKFYRAINEVPALFMVVIVILVVLKPF
jgi:protoporphyrinogen IX oxidase